MSVALDSIVLPVGPSEGGSSGFTLVAIGDWDRLPDSKSEVRERPQADGAFNVAHDYRQSLPFSVQGAYVASDRADAQTTKAYVKGVLGRGKSVLVVVTDADGAMRRTASVRSVVFEPDHNSTTLVFTVDLIAPDPLMYADTQVYTTGVPASGGGLVFPLGTNPLAYWDFGADGVSGRVSFTNYGNAPTWPTLQAIGGLTSGFIVTDVTTGQVVRFDRVVPVGSMVQINQRTGRAWIDAPSNDVSGQLTGRDFFSIGAGETHVIQFAPLGAPTGSPVFTLLAAPAFL